MSVEPVETMGAVPAKRSGALRARRIGTKTSAFGSPGRISHDSTAFYASRLYEHLPQEEPVEYTENPVPLEFLDRIFCKTSEHMEELPDNSIHLMVTSPPYNVGKEYDGNLTLAEYRELLKRVWSEVWRVLVPGGRACINVANLGRKPYIPLHAFIVQDMLDLGFLMRGEVIWNKGASGSPSTAWGSWLSPVNPTLRDVHEYILIFSKCTFSRRIASAETSARLRRGRSSEPTEPIGPKPARRRSTITREEFLEYTKSVWTFPAEPATKVGHPAPFPVELPYRLIQLYTFEGEVVLDPFMGSGQTGLAAIKANRRYVGYEINAEYVRLAEARIRAYVVG